MTCPSLDGVYEEVSYGLAGTLQQEERPKILSCLKHFQTGKRTLNMS